MAKGYSARGGFGGAQGQMMRQQQMQQKIMQMQQQMAMMAEALAQVTGGGLNAPVSAESAAPVAGEGRTQRSPMGRVYDSASELATGVVA